MPSKSYFWYTQHDDLTVLHINSTDPRRNGEQTLAMFHSDVFVGLIGNEWKERGQTIVNQFGESLLSILAEMYGFGKHAIQIEPNCDFTRHNYRKRSGNLANAGALVKYMEDPNWIAKRTHEKYNPPFHDRIKCKSAAEWCELPVAVDDGVVINIKINKRHAHLVPKRMVYRPQRKNPLWLVPNQQQNKRKKYDDDHRHGIAFSEHLLNAIDGTPYRTHRSDPLDYRIDPNTSRYICDLRVRNIYHNVADGVVLEVHYPNGVEKEWSGCRANVKPAQSVIFAGVERSAYFLIDANMKEHIADQDWGAFLGGDEAYCGRFKMPDNTVKKLVLLKRLVCEHNNAIIGAHTVASRMTKSYEAAINGGQDKYAKRAAYENRILSDQNTSGRMYTKRREILRKIVSCNKYVAIPELNVTALDVRFTSLRIGGSK